MCGICGAITLTRKHRLGEDLLRRTFKLLGLRVTQVMNITDVEDKIIARMSATGASLDEVTAPIVEAFFEDLATLGIERDEHYPRATEHVPEMIDLAKKNASAIGAGHTFILFLGEGF